MRTGEAEAEERLPDPSRPSQAVQAVLDTPMDALHLNLQTSVSDIGHLNSGLSASFY